MNKHLYVPLKHKRRRSFTKIRAVCDDDDDDDTAAKYSLSCSFLCKVNSNSKNEMINESMTFHQVHSMSTVVVTTTLPSFLTTDGIDLRIAAKSTLNCDISSIAYLSEDSLVALSKCGDGDDDDSYSYFIHSIYTSITSIIRVLSLNDCDLVPHLGWALMKCSGNSSEARQAMRQVLVMVMTLSSKMASNNAKDVNTTHDKQFNATTTSTGDNGDDGDDGDDEQMDISDLDIVRHPDDSLLASCILFGLGCAAGISDYNGAAQCDKAACTEMTTILISYCDIIRGILTKCNYSVTDSPLFSSIYLAKSSLQRFAIDFICKRQLGGVVMTVNDTNILENFDVPPYLTTSLFHLLDHASDNGVFVAMFYRAISRSMMMMTTHDARICQMLMNHCSTYVMQSTLDRSSESGDAYRGRDQAADLYLPGVVEFLNVLEHSNDNDNDNDFTLYLSAYPFAVWLSTICSKLISNNYSDILVLLSDVVLGGIPMFSFVKSGGDNTSQNVLEAALLVHAVAMRGLALLSKEEISSTTDAMIRCLTNPPPWAISFSMVSDVTTITMWYIVHVVMPHVSDCVSLMYTIANKLYELCSKEHSMESSGSLLSIMVSAAIRNSERRIELAQVVMQVIQSHLPHMCMGQMLFDQLAMLVIGICNRDLEYSMDSSRWFHVVDQSNPVCRLYVQAVDILFKCISPSRSVNVQKARGNEV